MPRREKEEIRSHDKFQIFNVPSQMRMRVSEQVDIVALTRAKDVAGLLRAFSLSQDWQGRELIVVAFQVIFKDTKGNDNFQSNAMASALKDIIMLCKAETSGGSYRENCIDCAQKMLEHLNNVSVKSTYI